MTARMKNSQWWMHSFLFVYVVALLFPLLWLFMSSFKTNRQITENTWSFPTSFNFDNYVAAWSTANIGKYALNSVFVTVTACLLTLLFAAMTSFAISRMKYEKMNKAVYQFILLGLLVPAGALFIPLYRLIQGIELFGHKLYDTHLSLILVYSTYALPITVFIIYAFMLSIPSELEEAGIMDGLGASGLFFRIIVPISVPALVTVFILNFIGNWNEYILSQLFITSESLRTLPTGMATFNDGYRTNFASLSAAVIISIIPVLLVYVFLQRQIIEGMTAGSVKG
ncbi:carbohydrate ABC transporter permease [Paenibacillus harenae]|uniref:Raffinose/stachyose/melibiose transport system permease protein n=1 Tax=Paenibacillus harenae TaxID=306543 RepID=A0ABT9U5K3_PAEHA|nr:carbohydrate ABC transporter permease [Paenibacillus harenae]MDQ0058831.1 raffinose/stachyose/melibiose transport system permease protein [Paenibacillus harenae]MDQ0114293.1 raffinose/stachyose/melibiose transport system permease protein [Paenibacillus harenae]